MIGAWMRDTNTNKWALGIHFVAAMKNDRMHTSLKGKCPYKLIYGQEKRVGLASIGLPSSLIHTLSTEEDLRTSLGFQFEDQENDEPEANAVEENAQADKIEFNFCM